MWGKASFGYRQRRHRYRKGKPTGTDATRVEVGDITVLLDAGPVRMSGDDDTESSCRWIDIDILDDMPHVNQSPIDVDDFGQRDGVPKFAAIDVPANDNSRCDFIQCVKNVRAIDVSGVQNDRSAFKSGNDFVTK